MIQRFRDAHPHLLQWVAGDEVYGGAPALRAWLEDQQIGYVLGVKCDTHVSTAVGRIRVDELTSRVPKNAWETYSCADGSKGPRLYDWTLIETTESAGPSRQLRHVLVRRGRDEKAELAFFLAHSPQPVPLATLVTVAGRRWGVEECFQAGKNEVGLDHYQVRLYRAWYRHVTLAMFAQAWLAISAAQSREKDPPTIDRGRCAVGYQRLSDGLPLVEPKAPDKHTMIPFSLNEIRHIFGLLGEVALPPTIVLWWSNWRRRHQAWARYYHYRRRIRAAQPSAAPS
jgi:hypothetical protein